MAAGITTMRPRVNTSSTGFSFLPRSFTRFVFALGIIGILASKAVHIYENLLFEPLSLQFIFFFPTVWLKDVLVILAIYVALYHARRGGSLQRLYKNESKCLITGKRNEERRFNPFLVALLEILRVAFRTVVGFILPIVCFITATSEQAFYMKSGQLISWSLFRSFMKDPAGNSVIFQGGAGALYGVVMYQLVLACLEPMLTRKFLALINTQSDANSPSPRSSYFRSHKYRNSDVEKNPIIVVEREMAERYIKPKIHATRNLLKKWQSKGNRKLTLPAVALYLYVFAFLLSFIRPVRKFDIMITTIPVSLLEILDDHKGKSSNGEFCGAGDKSLGAGLLEFPFPKMVTWNKRDNKYPEVDALSDWLPTPPPVGFERFTTENNQNWKAWGKLVSDKNHRNGEEHLPPKGYHHAFDPLKISNLHERLIPQLRNSEPPANDNGESMPLKDIKIRNIVMLTLESTRSQVFPFREGEAFVKSSIAQQTQKGIGYWNLWDATPFSKKLVGAEYGKGGSGGLFIEGAQTGASYTRKSFAVSHCGVSPLAIDWYEEKNAELYQPCIPHILKLLNDQPKLNKEDWREADWLVQYAQSVTFNWDKAILQMDQMGFERDELVYSDFLEAENATYPLDKEEKLLNAFGYREPVIKPYMRDHIKRSKQEGKRFFLSHLTSTTHAPWAVPTKKMGWLNKLFTDNTSRNSYFNTVSYVDQWLAEIFKMLEDEGVRDETLVVISGDHGIAIGEGSPQAAARWSPAHNTHVNTFRIPIVFHHPKMPNIHLPVNATNLSILPTILDLLLQTDSMPSETPAEQEHAGEFSRTKIIRSLLPAYEGQSLLRTFQHQSPLGLQNLNFGIVNPGSTRLVVTSSDPTVPFRLTMPLCDKVQYGVSNIHEDHEEIDPVSKWTVPELANAAGHRWGLRAKAWTEEAVVLARWWIREGRRRWHYTDSARHGSPKFENQFKRKKNHPQNQPQNKTKAKAPK